MDSLVASGRLQPEEAGLLHRDILQAEKRGASRRRDGHSGDTHNRACQGACGAK